MNKELSSGLIIGALSYLLFLILMFTKGLNFIFSLGTYPFTYIFPELKSNSVGLEGIPIIILGGSVSILFLLFLLWLVTKVSGIKASISGLILGFLGCAVLMNLLNLIFNFA